MMKGHETVQAETPSDNLFWAASVLARRGAYVQASSTLARALRAKQCSSIAAFDLQARIYAQAGSYREAEACWLKALSLGGRLEDFQPPLERLWRQARAARQSRHSLAVLAGIGLLFCTLYWAIYANGAATRQVIQAMAEGAQPDIAAVRNNAGEVARDVARLRETLGADLDADRKRLAEVQMELKSLTVALDEVRGLTLEIRSAASVKNDHGKIEDTIDKLTKAVEELKPMVASGPRP